MNSPALLSLLEAAVFESSLQDYGWQAAVLGPGGEAAGFGPNHLAAWSDFYTRHPAPDHDEDGREDSEGFVDSQGTYYDRTQALLAWRAEFSDRLKAKDQWTDRDPVSDPGDSFDLKLNLS